MSEESFFDKDTVKTLINKHIDSLLTAAGVGHWTVNLAFGEDMVQEGWKAAATCERLVDYDTAKITVDPEGWHDEAELVDTLRHEVFHIVLAPFDLFYSAAMTFVPPESRAAADVVFTYALEQTIINLERMHHAKDDDDRRDGIADSEPGDVLRADTHGAEGSTD